MICPICGEEMKQGYMDWIINFRELPFVWYPPDANTEKGVLKSLVSRMKRNDGIVCLPDKEDDPTAWYCPSCKKVWMSFDEVTDQ